MRGRVGLYGPGRSLVRAISIPTRCPNCVLLVSVPLLNGCTYVYTRRRLRRATVFEVLLLPLVGSTYEVNGGRLAQVLRFVNSYSVTQPLRRVRHDLYRLMQRFTHVTRLLRRGERCHPVAEVNTRRVVIDRDLVCATSGLLQERRYLQPFSRSISVDLDHGRCHVHTITITPYTPDFLVVLLGHVKGVMVGRRARQSLISSPARHHDNARCPDHTIRPALLPFYALIKARPHVVGVDKGPQ